MFGGTCIRLVKHVTYVFVANLPAETFTKEEEGIVTHLPFFDCSFFFLSKLASKSVSSYEFSYQIFSSAAEALITSSSAS